MKSIQWVLCGLIVMGLAMLSNQKLVAQDGGGPGPGRQWDPQQFRQMAMDRIREQLQTTDEEWQIISPRLERVMELNFRSGGRGFGGFRGQGGMGGPPGGGEDVDLSDQPLSVQKSAALGELLDNTESTAEQINQALGELREARVKAAAELADAQTGLREVLTLKQEARLVLAGLLE